MEIVLMFLILVIFVLVQAIVYHKFGLKNVTYTVSISCDEAFEGDEIEITEVVENNKLLPLPWLKTEICTSRWLEFQGTTVKSSAEMRFVPSVFMLKGRQKCTRRWKAKCIKRGVFSLEDTAVVSCDIFGLVHSSTKFRVDQSIRVLPTPFEIKDENISNDTYIGDIIVRRFILEDPFYISGAREYTGREAMNRIHWSCSAHSNELMVYNNEFTTDKSLLLIMNLQSVISDEKINIKPREIETAIKAAAYIIDKCYGMRVSFGFAANGTIARTGIVIPNGNSYEHCIQTLRVLAELNNECNIHIDDFIGKLDAGDYTDVAVITPFISKGMAEFADSVKMRRKNIVFYSNDLEPCDEYRIIPIGRYTHNFSAAEQ